MKQSDIIELSKKYGGILGTGSLNWLGSYNQEAKHMQATIFFRKESAARKLLSAITGDGAKIVKTPAFVNCYFKFGVLIPIE